MDERATGPGSTRKSAAERSDIHAAARIVVGAIALLFVSTVLYVTAFHAPHPRGFDVGVVGTPAQAARIQSRLDAANHGGFDVRRYRSEREARTALLDTEMHGVLVVGPRRDRILLAQALGVAPGEAVGDALGKVASASAIPAVGRDVRPLPSSDRRGLSSLFAVIGTLIPSLMFGVLLSVFGRRLPWLVRLSAILTYSLLAGLVVAFNVDVVAGALGSHFFGIALVSGLLGLAVSAATHGLAQLGGRAGILVAVLTLLLLGLSSSGGAVGYQFERASTAPCRNYSPGRSGHRRAQCRVLRLGGDRRVVPDSRLLGNSRARARPVRRALWPAPWAGAGGWSPIRHRPGGRRMTREERVHTERCPVCGRALTEDAAVIRLRGLTVHRRCAADRRCEQRRPTEILGPPPA